MNYDELQKAYKAFFIESPAGQGFMKELDRQLNDAHQKAEDEPELARDHVQRAKGIRQVKSHILGMGIAIKKARL